MCEIGNNPLFQKFSDLFFDEVDAFISKRKDSLGVVIGQMSFTIIIKIARSVPIGAIRNIVPSLRWFNALVVPLAKMSSHVIGVRFLQGLRNCNLPQVLLLCLHCGKHGVSETTGCHTMKQTIS